MSAGCRPRLARCASKVLKLRAQTFETAIIERYRRRESSVEEALIEMYLAGVSVRRVEDITEALWGARAVYGALERRDIIALIPAKAEPVKVARSPAPLSLRCPA